MVFATYVLARSENLSHPPPPARSAAHPSRTRCLLFLEAKLARVTFVSASPDLLLCMTFLHRVAVPAPGS